MSIIHDALKKTQRSLEETQNEFRETSSNMAPSLAQLSTISVRKFIPPNPKETKLSPSRPKGTYSAVRTGTWIFFIFILIIFIYTYNKYSEYLSQITTPKVKNQELVSPPPTKIIEAPPLPISSPASARSPKDPVIFNGTMTAGADKVAVINDQIYHIGEIVEGYTVKEIKQDQVVLEKNGESLTLDVRHK